METNKKQCSQCLIKYPISEEFFYTSKGKFLSKCKNCYKENNKAYKAKNRDKVKESKKRYRNKHPEAVRRHNIKYKYGLSEIEYVHILTKQNGLCAICCAKLSTQAHIDHNHRTGKIRGILCSNCNRGIGLLGESIENLQRAIDYINEETP